MPAKHNRRRIRSLRHVFKLQSVAKTRDTKGGTVLTPTDVAHDLRADVETVSSSQTGNSETVPSLDVYLITMRYRDGVTKQHQLVWVNNGDTVLDIVGIDRQDKFDGWMTVTAKERAPS